MEYLSHHYGAAFEPRLETKEFKASLARHALRNVPGAEALIKKTFESAPVPREIQPPKAEDLVLHTGFIRH